MKRLDPTLESFSKHKLYQLYLYYNTALDTKDTVASLEKVAPNQILTSHDVYKFHYYMTFFNLRESEFHQVRPHESAQLSGLLKALWLTRSNRVTFNAIIRNKQKCFDLKIADGYKTGKPKIDEFLYALAEPILMAKHLGYCENTPDFQYLLDTYAECHNTLPLGYFIIAHLYGMESLFQLNLEQQEIMEALSTTININASEIYEILIKCYSFQLYEWYPIEFLHALVKTPDNEIEA